MSAPHSHTYLHTTILYLLLTNCSTHEDRPNTSATNNLSNQITTTSLTPKSKPDFIDEDGSRYIWQRTIIPEHFDANQIRNSNDAQLASTHKRIKDMSVSELASKLRSRMFRNGEEYLLDHDPTELAEQVLAALHTGTPPPPTKGHQAKFEELPPQQNEDITTTPPPMSPKNIIGPDNRISYDHASISWPAMTSLWIEGIDCSSTIIGTRMVATAAHCFFNGTASNFGTGKYVPYASDTAPTQAYGSFTSSAIFYPAGWNGSDWQFDFAQVRFPANTFSNWGWVGTNSGHDGQSCNMWGYPTDKPHPQLWLKSGTVNKGTPCPGHYPHCGQSTYYHCATRQSLRHNLDIMPGDSGAGLLSAAGVQLVGIQSTQWRTGTVSPPTLINYPNEARQWDFTTYAYFSGSGIWP